MGEDTKDERHVRVHSHRLDRKASRGARLGALACAPAGRRRGRRRPRTGDLAGRAESPSKAPRYAPSVVDDRRPEPGGDAAAQGSPSAVSRAPSRAAGARPRGSGCAREGGDPSARCRGGPGPRGALSAHGVAALLRRVGAARGRPRNELPRRDRQDPHPPGACDAARRTGSEPRKRGTDAHGTARSLDAGRAACAQGS